MKGDRLDVVRAWFKKAENDLINAENTIKMEKPPFDTICFHAQQCAVTINLGSDPIADIK